MMALYLALCDLEGRLKQGNCLYRIAVRFEETMNTHATGVGDNTQSLFIAMLQTLSGMNRNWETG